MEKALLQGCSEVLGLYEIVGEGRSFQLSFYGQDWVHSGRARLIYVSQASLRKFQGSRGGPRGRPGGPGRNKRARGDPSAVLRFHGPLGLARGPPQGP